MLKERVAVGTVGEGHVEDFGVFERLLHPGADGVVVVLRFEDREREIGFIGKQVVGFLGVAAFHRLATNDDAALGEVGLLADLGQQIPFVAVRSDQRGRSARPTTEILRDARNRSVQSTDECFPNT